MPRYVDSAVNALYYNIFVCPHCGFSYSEDFSRYFPHYNGNHYGKSKLPVGSPPF
ncbi:DUF2225 domain-containing protein [Peribacillus frigoritolerans]|uniref:DUF2225 domain-containing protein n=1 Tax=Peribacillus TaxID=2675229 RepID=UPI0021AA76E4|nr:DUF2225 domain-containing protein [Peribacillus frigoritolerans]MCT4479381.1 DUF2225 domain-containing protein [Peribacillus frigoritolerans]